MADFTGWDDMNMQWGDADAIRLNDVWMMLEMFRQAIIERCEKVYPFAYYAYYNFYPGPDEWKTMLLDREKMLNEFPRLSNLKAHIDLLNSQLDNMLNTPFHYRLVWGCFKGAGSYLEFNDGQAADNVRWNEPQDGGVFHVGKVINWGRSQTAVIPVPVSFDTVLNGSILSVTDVTQNFHGWGAPASFQLACASLDKAKLIALTDPDNVDWHSRLSKLDSDALRKWANQFYHMLNLLVMPSASGRIGYGTTVGMEGSTEEDYVEEQRYASVECWGNWSVAYWSGMTEEDWGNNEGLSLEDAWGRSKWTGQNGCAYAYRPEKSYYDPNDPSMGYSEYAVRRRQWFKLVNGNTGAFKDITGVNAKQEMYLYEYPEGGNYLNEIGGQNSWVTLCDMEVPAGDGKSARIESGNIGGIPGSGGWEAELRRVTITAEVDLNSTLNLKFVNAE